MMSVRRLVGVASSLGGVSKAVADGRAGYAAQQDVVAHGNGTWVDQRG